MLMLRRCTLIALLLAAATASPAAAYNCELPGLDPIKRTVCRSKELRRLDTAERNLLHTTSAKLGVTAIGIMRADRDKFIKDRKACRTDVRCLDAVYNAQVRLYGEIAAACEKPAGDQSECTQTTIAKHREALHQSR
jgi:uncharacterized protein